MAEGNISEHRNGLCFPLARTISHISIPTPTNIHTKAQGTSHAFRCDAPGFSDSAEENVSEPGAAETGGLGCPDCSLETDLLRTNRASKGRAERSKEKVL